MHILITENGERRMENGNYHYRPHVVRIFALSTHSDLKSLLSSIMHFLCVHRPSPRSFLNPWRGNFIHSIFSILRKWALCHSRRACHIPILHSPRMGRKRCDNPIVDMLMQHDICCVNLIGRNRRR